MELVLVSKDNVFEDSIFKTQENISVLSKSTNSRLLQLEGECKIKYIRLLKFDYIKTFLLIVPVIVTIIPLLLLKYYISFRVKVFYRDSIQDQATYAFIEGVDGNQQIEPFLKEDKHGSFYFKNLRYNYYNGEAVPRGYEFQNTFSQISSHEYITRGTSQLIRVQNQKAYGTNEHKVQIPNYFEYLFDILLQPFFLLQYLICVIFGFENQIVYVALYLSFSYATTTINYILLYISFSKIKEIAEKQIEVVVIRDGQRITIKNHGLVPGDIVIPQNGDQVSFDGILLDGQVFVNQASLTGQSIPVGKFPAQNIHKTKEQNRWLFEGAKVLQSRPDTRVVVINTGYATRRGRIIRKILTRIPFVPDFFKTAVYFLIQTCSIGLILYLATLPLMINKIVTNFLVFRMLDILAWSFPPSFPIFFNLAYSFSLTRLKWQGIMGTQPQKATQASKIKTFCFDKTGTLTQNQLQVYEVIKFNNESSYQTIDNKNDPKDNLILKLFASCHTVRLVGENFLGDEVDLRMFLFSEYKMTTCQQKNVRFIVTNSQGDSLEILRINQFESKFQNMSVLVRDTKSNKYMVFIKGAPQRIDRNSTMKLKQFQNLVSSLSLRGFRTIGFGFKQIANQEVQKYISGERDIFQIGIQAMGLVAFQNKLKEDTKDTIQRLIESDIEPKMITGDNIFIAVQTGYRSGILRPNEKVVIFQGRKQKTTSSINRVFQGLILQKDGDNITQTKVSMAEETDYINQTEFAIAIDNDFLSLLPEPQITGKIKLFSRISPENKVKVVRLFKQQEKSLFQASSRSEKWFGPGLCKVGMCGDGANDLMAIREADVGVAISDSDASYGASFTITKMLQVDHIIRESKNTSQSIVDMIRYFGTVSFLKVITSILLVSDITYFNPNQVSYFNFANSIWLACFMGLSSPAATPTKRRPLCNMMSLQNHIIYWANIILPTAGFCAAYFYFKQSPAFIPNPLQQVDSIKGYLGTKCTSNTIVWLMINLPIIINAITIYNSMPFKCRFFHNIPLMITFIGNLIPAIVFFFFTGQMTSGLGLVGIPNEQTGGVLGIMAIFLLTSIIFNHFFHKWFVKQS